MRSFCQVGIQKKSVFIAVLLLLLYQHFSELRIITGSTGKAGFTCLDTGKHSGLWTWLSEIIELSSCKNRADSVLNGSGYCVSKISTTVCTGFSQFLKLMIAILRLQMLHADH